MAVTRSSWCDFCGGAQPRLAAGMGALALGVAAGACKPGNETRRLDPESVAITADTPPAYDDGELVYYEVKRPLEFPVRRWESGGLREFREESIDPYGRRPWLENTDLEVQVTWTLTNLDPQTHEVRLLVDPWNEFGRYYPGLALLDAEDGEFLPMLSGFDDFLELPGTDDEFGRSSRKTGTLTFEDMDEMAIDFATVMNILDKVPSPAADETDNPIVTFTNNAFNQQNRHYNSPLVERFIPAVIPGLTGVDFGLRTYEPANIALEVVVELVDGGRERLIPEDDDGDVRAIGEPGEYITAGAAGP